MEDRTIRKFLNKTYIPPKVYPKIDEESNASKYLLEFLVVKNVQIPIIIGYPALQKMGAIIDCENNSVTFGTNFINYTNKLIKQIYTQKEMKILPNHEAA